MPTYVHQRQGKGVLLVNRLPTPCSAGTWWGGPSLCTHPAATMAPNTMSAMENLTVLLELLHNRERETNMGLVCVLLLLLLSGYLLRQSTAHLRMKGYPKP